MKNISILMILVVLVAGITHAQTPGPNQPIPCERRLRDALSRPAGPERDRAVGNFLLFSGRTECMAELVLLSPQFQSHVGSAAINQAKAALQQNGSSVGTGGTTNLISKGFTSEVLSVASEYGALTETVSNQTVSVQGSLAGIPIALIRSGVFTECSSRLIEHQPCVGHRRLQYLGRISYSVSFDASKNSQSLSGTPSGAQQGSAQPVTFVANAHQINQVTGKWVIIPGNPATKADFIKGVQTAINNSQSPTGAAGPALKKAGDKLKALEGSIDPDIDSPTDGSTLANWRNAATQFLENAPQGDDQEVFVSWRRLGCSLVNAMNGPQQPCQVLGNIVGTPDPESPLFDEADAYVNAANNYRIAELLFAESLRGSPVLTFEYNENRPVSQPTNSVFRMIYGQVVGKWTFNVNAAASIYDSTPRSTIPGASRFRDAQFGAEIDRSFGNLPLLGPTTGSIAYYFQHQASPAILNVTPGAPVTGVTFTGLPATATQVFAQKGNISVAQARIAVGPNNSSLKFPVAVSWSNRTELITKSVWRGQVGISYDFDSLFTGGGSK